MKISKVEWAAILLAGGFVLFFAGWFFRGQSPQAGTYVISSQRLAGEALPSPTPEVFVPDKLVNLNTATQPELESLPGIGAVRAAAILAYREEHGPFARIEDLTQVEGIGQSTFENLEAYVTVAPGEGGGEP